MGSTCIGPVSVKKKSSILHCSVSNVGLEAASSLQHSHDLIAVLDSPLGMACGNLFAVLVILELYSSRDRESGRK